MDHNPYEPPKSFGAAIEATVPSTESVIVYNNTLPAEKVKVPRDTGNETVQSLYDALNERGMIGSITDGPGDQ